MKLNQNDTIRLNIMLIAVLGGLLFLCYLLANVYMARQNAQRLERLLFQQYPVIEQIRLIKRDARMIQESMVSAVGWESGFLLDESDEVVQQLQEDMAALSRLDSNLDTFVRQFSSAFLQYHSMAKDLAEKLIENPDFVRSYRGDLEYVHRLYEQLVDLLDQTLEEKQQAYTALLKKTNTSVEKSNMVGAILGGGVIIVLVILAWGISVRVIQEINRTNRLKDEFLATISHELRTPMNGVMGALSLLSTSNLTESQSSWLSAASRSADAMMLSIDDILQLSEIMSDRYRILETPFDIRIQLEKLLGLFASDIESSQLSVRIDIDPEVEGRKLCTDEEKVFLVLRHLLSNAIKFSRRGGEVEVSVARSSMKSDYIEVEIRDSGPGVPEKQIPELFNPFQQLDGSFTRKFQGMGIGLAIIRALVKILKGSIKLNNHEEGGLIAHFYFPVQSEDIEMVKEGGATDDENNQPGRVIAQNKDVKILPLNAEYPAPVSGLPRILVVEDNQVNQMVLKGYLKKLGCEVLTANNGEEALAELSKNTVDLVFMDCQMPVMDGFEASRKIREMDEPFKSLPIVAVTANAMERDREQCQEAGMDGYLKKPVNIEKIQAELKCRLARVA